MSADPMANRVLLTLRVSQDNGRTFTAQRTYRAGDLGAPLVSLAWPPCQCPLHRGRNAR
jgi:hypothetical protein